MNRRGFLKTLGAGAVTATAALTIPGEKERFLLKQYGRPDGEPIEVSSAPTAGTWWLVPSNGLFSAEFMGAWALSA